MDFVWGILDGVVAPLVVWLNLFGNDFGFYDTARNGFWYQFGFISGVGTIGRSCTAVSTRVRRGNDE